MVEQYVEMVERLCAANIAAEVQSLNMKQAQTGQQIHGIYQTLSSEDASACIEAYVGYLSYSVNSASPPEVLQSYMSAAIGVPSAQRPALRDAVAHAYSRIDANTAPHGPFFRAAGLFRVVLPAQTHERLALVPLRNHMDEGFSYRSYLTLIEDPNGPEGFAAALAQVQPNVDSTSNLASALSSLAVLLKREARDATALLRVLSPLREDERRSTGVNGPESGPAIKDIVLPVFKVFQQD